MLSSIRIKGFNFLELPPGIVRKLRARSEKEDQDCDVRYVLARNSWTGSELRCAAGRRALVTEPARREQNRQYVNERSRSAPT